MSEERSSPVLPQILLLGAFLVITAVGVITVVVPELWDDSEGSGQTDGSDAPEPEAEPEAEPDE